jgi:hypothetical protein
VEREDRRAALTMETTWVTRKAHVGVKRKELQEERWTKEGVRNHVA